MTRPRPQLEPEPRVWSEHQVACRFGRDESWLSDNRPTLEATGFPQIDDLLGGTEADAVNRWLDGRAGNSAHMPNWVKIGGLAEWFDDSVSTTRRKLPELYAEGFPEPALGKWYIPACDEWAKARAAPVNIAAPRQMNDPLMEALNGQRQH